MGRTFEGHKGSILIMTIMFLVVLTIVAMALLNTVMYNTTNANVQYNSMQALYLAEAGISKAIYYLRNTAPDGTGNGSWRTTVHPAAAGNTAPASCTASDPCEENLGDGSYTMWVEDSGADIRVTATGNFNGVNRTASQKIGLPTTDGLVSYWKFNETSGTSVADSSGQSVTGTVTGGAPTWTTGHNGVNNAISLSGSNYVDFGTTANAFNYSAGDFSYSVWVKGNDQGYFMQFFNGDSSRQMTVHHWGLGNSGEIGYTTSSISCAWGSGGGQITDNNWHHVLFTYDSGGSFTAYLDGVQTCSASTAPAGSFDTRGGAHYIGTGYAGLIDEARIYNKVLTAGEIAQLYDEFEIIDDSWQECKVLCS